MNANVDLRWPRRFQVSVRQTSCVLKGILLSLAFVGNAFAQQSWTQAEAAEKLDQVVEFYRKEVGYQGAYLWRYSADLTQQEGEGKASKTSGWTQPPGAPTVGEAYLEAYRVSRCPKCLEAAVEVAHALVRSQLASGGWSSHFDLGEPGRTRYAYRVDQKRGKNNYTTFDDNKSQSALQLLMHVDEQLNMQDEVIHEAVAYALARMLAAQYPNGAWPQQYSDVIDTSNRPVVAASYPESWPREYPRNDYRGYYTLNDNNMQHIIEMLLEAHRIYGRDDCYQAACSTGDFFLLAQMPDPQPGWAQQYNLDMHPAWARKFEPASITGGESQSVMMSLMSLYRHTNDKKYMEPILRALDYYERSLLADGRLARFYELKSNRPLYFTKDYRLTYSDEDMPTHYAFQVTSRLDSIRREYDSLLGTPASQLKPVAKKSRPVKLTSSVRRQAAECLESLDSRGAWVEAGSLRSAEQVKQIVDMKTFAKNLVVVAKYVGAN